MSTKFTPDPPSGLTFEDIVEGAAQAFHREHYPHIAWADELPAYRSAVKNHMQAALDWIRAQPGWTIQHIPQPGGEHGWDGERPE